MQKTNIPQTESKSVDLIAQNLEQLKQIFPEVIKEGKVDFEALHDLLGNYGDTAEERFALNWAGKANARREAQKRSTGTLRPCPEESVDWDTTDNLYIEGDNLEVLKLLQKSYHSRVKMIYIDPPYNTGKDFVYKDNYADNMKNYLELTGQDKKLSTNTESDGRYHSNWLNMMYPRLKLARNLLTDDGVIFISIDDNEVANLRKICDEVFGEENFVSDIIWQKKTGASDSVSISTITESILVYVKNAINVANIFSKNTESYDLNRYKYKDEFHQHRGPYYIDNLDRGGLQYSDSLNYSIECPDGTITYPNGRKEYKNDGWIWKWSKEKIEWARKNKFIEFRKSDNKESGWSVCYKNYLRVDNENKPIERAAPHKNLITSILNANSSADMKFLFTERVFQYTKPVDLIAFFIKMVKQDLSSIILDFFSGSATTAHAVMQLNAEDGGNRKYICVQLPEQTPEDSEARKAGYATIPEIAKERIRRAGKKIVEEQKTKAENQGGLFTEEEKKLDIGFKVFKLDSSNINAWDSNPDNLEASLHNSLFNIKEDRSEDDLLYEILIKYGIELTEKINSHIIDGKTVYEMGAGSLIVCLADSLSTAVADGIGKLYKEVSPEGVDANCRVVFKEVGFNGSDEVKTNTLLILKQHGITNVATV